MLFRDGLVMYDRETDTLWTHVDGRAIKGPLAGRTLEIVPSIHATWKEWKTLYPESVVLEKRGVFRSPYFDYNRSGKAGILGRPLRDKRLAAKERIVGVRSAESAMAFPEKAVRDARLVQTNVGSLPVVLVAPEKGLPIVTFDRRVDNRVLKFHLDAGPTPALIDEETGSRWRIADGEAVVGPLKGQRLSRAPAYPAFWFGWVGYFPSTDLWTSR